MNDPVTVIEGIAQGASDAVDNKGIFYSVGYIIPSVFGEKGLDKAGDVITGLRGVEGASVLSKISRREKILDAGEIGNPITGTVWDDIISAAGDISYTKIPVTFEMKLNNSIKYTNPTTGFKSLWTNANATEHMGEYLLRFGGETASTGIRSQIMLESYNAALNKAMLTISNKAPGRYFDVFGNWELGINTKTGVVYHARMIK